TCCRCLFDSANSGLVHGALFDGITLPVWLTAPVSQSSLDEAQPHRALRVVPVEVDQHDALPGPEQWFTRLHRNCHRRRDQRGQDVVGAMAGRTVLMAVAVVAREEPVEGVDEVVVAAGA